MSNFTPGPYSDYRTLERVAAAALANGRANGLHDTTAIAAEMRMNRQADLRKTGVIGGGYNGSGISFATARPRDPMFYWREANLPFEYTKDEEIIRLRQYARLVYLTDPVMASCIDVYSYWPLTGMHVEHKDPSIQDFYEELFMDENSGLNYEEFLPEMLHEYWLTGEAFPLGHFNELLGIWEYDELINADDVKVIKSPFMREPRFELKVPEEIRKIVIERDPKWEFAKLVQAYPEFLRLAQTEEFMPVSNALMRQVAFKADKFHHRGLPIMMRAFRSLYQQEMLNAAMDSIASRLYTPLVLVRLGASATDTGTDTAWVPSAQQLEEFQESLDIALAADFRVLTSHFATQVDLVFGREAMPDLGPDFDRIMDNKLLAFGLSRTMLMGASCLAGDTEVHLNRATKGYRTTIEKLARRYAGEPICGRPWDPEVPTFISRADGEVVRLGLVGNVWFSGVKETFELVTESGKTVRASAQHPFLTASGEWVELGELNVGDQVQVNTGRSTGEDLALHQGYKFVYTSHHPYQVNDGWHRAQYRYKVSVHRAVMDAALNNLSYKEFIRIVREDPLRSKELVYLDPAQFHVHHLDENK